MLMSKISIPQKSEVMSFGHWSKKTKTVPVSGIDRREFLGWQAPTNQTYLSIRTEYFLMSSQWFAQNYSKDNSYLSCIICSIFP